MGSPSAIPIRNFEFQKNLGKALREQYEPPKELPHRLFVLLLELDKSD
jgi:hypothetical protein